MPMTLRLGFVALLLVASTHLVGSQQEPGANQIKQEREQAELDAPKLVEVLGVEPGMTIADIGSGGGAMSVVLGHWNRGGKVFATDITPHALRWTRDYVARERLTNVVVIEGAPAATNLPDACCDAVFLRHVYHHITEVAAFNASLRASLKPGGRLAIIDFEGRPNPAQIPKGVPANRLGHGIPASVVIEEVTAAGFTHVRTIDAWPPGDKRPTVHLTLFRK